MLGVRELFRVARHDSVAKWEIVTLSGVDSLLTVTFMGWKPTLSWRVALDP